METETSLSQEQQPDTLTCSEPDNSCHKISRYFKNYFNIIISKKKTFVIFYCIFLCVLLSILCVLWSVLFLLMYITVLVLCTSLWPIATGWKTNCSKEISYHIQSSLFLSYFPTNTLRGKPIAVNKYRILIQIVFFFRIFLENTVWKTNCSK